MQVKNHCTPIRIAFKKLVCFSVNSKCWQDVEKLDLIFCQMLSGTAILEKSLALFLNLHICTPEYLFHRNKNLCLHENLYMTVHSSFIHNQNLQVTQISFSRSLKQTGISDGMLMVCNKMVWPIDTCSDSSEFQENYAAWKTPTSKGHIWFHLYSV